MSDAPKELYFYDDWLAQHTKGKLLCGNNRYLHADHVDALEAQASAEGFDRGVQEAQPIVESLRAELHALYAAIGFDPTELENGPADARQALDAMLKAEREAGKLEGLREAARYLQSLCVCSQVTCASESDCDMDRQRARDILALIEKDATDG